MIKKTVNNIQKLYVCIRTLSWLNVGKLFTQPIITIGSLFMVKNSWGMKHRDPGMGLCDT